MYRTITKLLRLVPNGLPGKTRVAHWLLNQYLNGGEGEVCDTNGFRYAVPDLREPIAFHLLIDGCYEPELLQFVSGILKPGGVFVDVGANVGVFTLPVAGQVETSGRVLALEASPRVYSYLNRNVQNAGLRNVTCRNVAVCARDGEVGFYDAPSNKFGMGSMANRFESDPVKVPGKTLASLIAEAGVSHVDVIKVDVEGFEADVFEGARALLVGEHPPLIVFEFCDWAERSAFKDDAGKAQRILMEQGFSVWLLDDFIRGLESLKKPVTEGFETLVARRGK